MRKDYPVRINMQSDFPVRISKLSDLYRRFSCWGPLQRFGCHRAILSEVLKDELTKSILVKVLCDVFFDFKAKEFCTPLANAFTRPDDCPPFHIP